MQRFFIQCANFFLLVLLLTGVPAAVHAQMGGWEITPASTLHHLIFAGLLVAAAANAISAMCFIKSRKERTLCWEWALVFSGLLAVQFAFNHGCFNFEWLKKSLLWLQKHF